MYPLFELESDVLKEEARFRELSQVVVGQIQSPLETVTIPSASSVRAGLPEGLVPVFLEEGSLYLELNQQRLLMLEQGDVLRAFLPESDARVDLHSEFAVKIKCATPAHYDALLQEVSIGSALHAAERCGIHYLLLLLSSVDLLGAEYKPRLLTFSAGETIIEQGDDSEEVYTLGEGSLEVLVDDVVVGEVQEGEIFGVIAAFSDTKRSATVRAKTDSYVLELPKSQFEALIRANPSTVSRLIESMSRSLVAQNTKLVLQEKGEILK